MPSSPKDLSTSDAEAIARQHLESKNLNNELTNRTVTVNRQGENFQVVFEPPSGVRAGAFTITVDKLGTVIAQRFER